MNKVQIMIYVIFLFLEVIGIASTMEIYKKQIRKNKAKPTEIYIAAEILSALGVYILNALNIFKPILGMIGAPLWGDYILYNILIYIFQMQADMKIIKKVIRSCTTTFLSSYGFSSDQIQDIFESIDKKKEETSQE